jgi:MFS family permease
VLARAGTLLAPFLLGHALGRLVDRMGFVVPLAGSMLLGAISSAALAFLPRSASPVVLTGLGALVLGGFGTGNAAANTALGKERFARARHPYEREFLGLTNAGVGLGAALGSALGGVLPGLWSAVDGDLGAYRGTFLTLAATSALVGAVTLALGRRGRGPSAS